MERQWAVHPNPPQTGVFGGHVAWDGCGVGHDRELGRRAGDGEEVPRFGGPAGHGDWPAGSGTSASGSGKEIEAEP